MNEPGTVAPPPNPTTMPGTPRPLLCELHAHSTWSDGALDLRALVDLYRGAGFDVLAVTDHLHRSVGRGVNPENFDAYLAAVEAEAERAAPATAYSSSPGSSSRTTTPIPGGQRTCSRHDFFDWVARARLPVVADGDFHRPEHLATWKTLLPAEKREEAVLAYLRSPRPVSLTAFEAARAA